jgi:YidC/Oxa1 family membrane protein insertase
MEKRTLIAVVLAILIMVVWYGFIAPPPKRSEDPERATPAVGGESQVEGQPDESTPFTGEGLSEGEESAEEPELAEPDAERIAADGEETVRVSQRFFEIELTNAGARALSWKLIDYTTPDGQPLELLPRYQDGESAFLSVELDDPVLSDALNEALYVVERERLFAEGEQGPGERITFEWSDGRGLSARKVLEFREDDYLVSVVLEVIDRGRVRPARLVLGPGFGAQEEAGARSNYYYDGQIAVNRAGEVTRLKRRKLGADTTVAGNFVWAGIEDQYFTALVLPPGTDDRITWRSVELTALPQPGAALDDKAPEARKEPLIAVSLPEEGGWLYIGPKKYKLLREIGFELDKAVWFSSIDWLRPIVKYLFLALLWFYDTIAGNYGLAIVLATVVLRLLLFPVNQYSMVSMKKSQLQMQRLQPKIKAIKAKYKKKDAQSRGKINQETMELYRKEGVNPMGGLTGCLPLLAQFPILIGFYNMLTVAVELRGAPFFGWIQDLSLKDPFYITPVLMGVTMFIQQKMAMSKIKDPQQLQQQRIMLFMPIMFTVICVQMPAGLVLYWFVNNLLGMGQQWLVNRQTGRLELPPPKPKKKSKA